MILVFYFPLISTGHCHVTYYFYNVTTDAIFVYVECIIKCEFVKELEEFLENRNPDINVDQFTKIVSKCFNLTRCSLGLLYIIETIE
jgi:hypothetical protein